MSHEEKQQLSTARLRPGVFVKTHGCQMNEYDSEKMLALLSEDYSRVQTAEEAKLVIINTCSVRDKAEHKLYSLLGRIRELKLQNPDLVVGVGGCVAQQEGEAIIKRNKVVDFVVGTHNLSLIPSLVRAVQSGRGKQVAVDYRDEWEDLPYDFSLFPDDAPPEDHAIGMFSSPVRAMVSIQRGCNKNCAYCVVPTTRGPEVSRPVAEIERELKIKVRRGAKEVLLLGQTVNSFGRDLNPRMSFETLVRRLAEIEGLERIRFISPHPAEVRPGFIQLYAEIPKLMPQIHMPLQSGSDRILKLMNRNYRIARYIEILEQLRSVRSDIAVSTDLIVGFPTETDEDFRCSLDILRQVRYVSAYLFKYSKRPNTVAKEQYCEADEVAESVKQERLVELQNLQEQISAEINSEMLGKKTEVLVEGASKNIISLMKGRDPYNHQVEITGGNPAVGEIVSVLVEHVGAYGLRGRICQQEEMYHAEAC